MKRLVKFFGVVFLIIAGCMISLEAYRYLNLEEQIENNTGKSAHTLLKEFAFASEACLEGWEENRLASRKTDYNIIEYDGGKCLRAVSNDSASSLLYRYRFSCKNEPCISWEWKVEEFPVLKYNEVLNKKDEFDFAAQFYIIFSANSFLRTKAIQYLWTKEIPAGTIAENPYTKQVGIIVLESGLSDEWKREKRNIKEDYFRVFGEELTKDIEAIAFMTDADSTNSRAIAYYRNIELEKIQPSLVNHIRQSRQKV